jgi:MFS family permease
MASSLSEGIYARLVDEEDARVCRDISEEACVEVPRNFFLLVVSSFLTKLGDAIADAKTTLPWLMSALGAPVALTGLLVPIRESGSLIPQLAIAAYVRRQPVRKWAWVVGAVLQAAAVAAMTVVASVLSGPTAGAALLGCLVMFSLARGLSSVASKDVLGKTIPRTRRGRVNGWSASAAGLGSLGVGAALATHQSDAASRGGYVVLLLAAAGLWLVAAVVYAFIVEEPGETEGGGNALTHALGKLRLLRDDAVFRRFVIARALLLCSALTAPYYVLLAREHTQGTMRQLGVFILAAGVASMVSAPIWGLMADWSSRRVMVLGALITGFLGVFAFATEKAAPGVAGQPWFYPAVFLVLSVAHSGVRLGRKTYLVDLASGNRRTDYVAVSNSVIGVVLLLLGGMGAVAQAFSVPVVILVLSLLGLAGAGVSRQLPEAGSDGPP